MRNKKIVLALSTVALLALASCRPSDTTTTTGVTPTDETSSIPTESTDPVSHDMDQYIDANDRKDGGKTFFASPSAPIEYDFEKELREEKQDAPKHKGTIDDPMDIYTALHYIGAQDTLYLLPGTYDTPVRITLSQSGNAKRRIKVRAYNDETHKGTVTIDFSKQETLDSNRGIQVNGSYWDFYGFDVMGAGDNGMYIAGSFNKVERCNFHENRDTGLQLGRANGNQGAVYEWPHNNYILNCTSYNNYDVDTLGENADGFAAKLTVGEGNVFDGCIAYRNADDGWDMFAKVDSGNIGTITLLNCVAFENGFVLDKQESKTKLLPTDENYLVSYATQNGDGNGFKLGGSTMEGDMILKNCMAFNNRMGGFADNSNPGTLQLFDCTAYNNSVYMYMTDKNRQIDPTGDTGDFGANDGECLNFAMARTEGSYNTFDGCLSYVSNQTDPTVAYSNFDTYKGSAAYSIFASGVNKYLQITDAIDASSYETKKAGTAFTGTLNDSSFKSVDLSAALLGGKTVKGNREIDAKLRNADGSVNMGDFLALKDENLLKFNRGRAIGCTLNKASMADYEHIDWVIPTLEGKDQSNDYVKAQAAIDALEVMANPDAVFQDVKLITNANGLIVSWYSSDESVLAIGYDETTAISSRNYLIGNVKRDRYEDKTVELVATVASKSVVLTKTFTLTIKKENTSIGKIIGYDKKYNVEQFELFNLPEFIATDSESYANNPLVLGKDYTVTTTFEYSESSNSKSYPVDNVYTSVPGVYKVTGVIHSLIDEQTKDITVSYLVYVKSKNAQIDISNNADLAATYSIEMTNELAYQVNATRDGVKVSAAFTNIYGYMYIATAAAGETLTKEQIMANGTRVLIDDEYTEGIAPNENLNEYEVFIVISNRATDPTRLITSEIYTAHINKQDINTPQEFYEVVAKKSNSTTIYLLQQDLDFTGFNYASSTVPFTGLLNGNGHTVSNVNIERDTKDKTANMIYKLKNGTIMNINFSNITIKATNTGDQDTGIIGNMCGGYIHNVALKNIKVNGVTEVATLVGQISGGSNFVTQVSLVNPLESGWISASSKYFGGLLGNMQKDTDQLKVELTVEDVYVKAYVGDHNDKGYEGGVLGRNKNEFESYRMVLNRVYFEGIVDSGYTYSGGIVGSIDSATGHMTITNCVSDCTLIIKDTVLDKDLTEIGQKNNSPIAGRFTANDLTDLYTTNNFGPYEEYNVAKLNSRTDVAGVEFKDLIKSENFFKTNVKFDLENVWEFVTPEEGNPYIILRNAK